jgi:hypothetical protein
VTKVSSLRASDSDRERVAERLRRATAEGRLSAEELEERLDVLFAARTFGELDPLLSDLSASRSPRWQRLLAARCAGAVTGTLMLALLGRLALKRGHSGAAPVPVPGHPGRVRFRDPLVDPHQGLIVAVSLVANASRQPAWPFAAQALLSRELRVHRAVAAEFIETELLLRHTASRPVAPGTGGGAYD